MRLEKALRNLPTGKYVFRERGEWAGIVTKLPSGLIFAAVEHIPSGSGLGYEFDTIPQAAGWLVEGKPVIPNNKWESEDSFFARHPEDGQACAEVRAIEASRKGVKSRWIA